ncbi:MAG: hypothetical protein R3176_03905 [Woeseiaceae bacterium]|nr:hypothetical protein [Woeseiaceae bacterium]
MSEFVATVRGRAVAFAALLAARPRVQAWLRGAGIVLFVAALQAFAFHRQVEPRITDAATALAALQQEVSDNRLANLSLETLQEYWTAVGDEPARRRILELRDDVVARFPEDPAGAVRELARVARSFEPSTPVEEEILAALVARVDRLEALYRDHYAAAIAAYEQPTWYLQPTAGLLNDDRETSAALAFNRALYLVAVRDAGAAFEIFDDLRERPEFESGPLRARLLYAIGRLHVQAWEVQKDPAFLGEALQYTQQSLRADAAFAEPGLMLDFLLSIDRNATQVDMAPTDGEGSGEGEGERGAIVTDPEDF